MRNIAAISLAAIVAAGGMTIPALAQSSRASAPAIQAQNTYLLSQQARLRRSALQTATPLSIANQREH